MDSFRIILISVILVVPFVHCIPQGYFYSRPDMAFELPRIESNKLTRHTGQVLQKTVSFKVSHEAHQPFNVYADGVFINPNRPATNGYYSEGTLQNNNPYSVDTLNGNAIQNTYSSQDTNSFLNNVNNGYSPANQLSKIQSDILGVTSQTTQSPSIIKHIYFHVPQPDVEENVRPIKPQAKKTYRIVFIKLPAQTLFNSRTQSIIKPSTIEEKTLIYVLIKKPEEKQIIVPKSHKLSEHEVVFVKYKENMATRTETIETPRRILSNFQDEI
ncbi:uncharacterized protein LOC125062504 [Pieris napi]|uniref:uncharacterized protein LOC125062504 n=1 Tax=Pieris napi TaxID=78633 RepID=UPI001FB91A17|nr:uncharacterized protein LOC125062504 [Pieris napi]